MSDSELRALERAASTGDPEAVAAYRRAQCRAIGHDPADGSLFFRFTAETMVDADSRPAMFHRCQRCGAEVPYEGALFPLMTGQLQFTSIYEPGSGFGATTEREAMAERARARSYPAKPRPGKRKRKRR